MGVAHLGCLAAFLAAPTAAAPGALAAVRRCRRRRAGTARRSTATRRHRVLELRGVYGANLPQQLDGARHLRLGDLQVGYSLRVDDDEVSTPLSVGSVAFHCTREHERALLLHPRERLVRISADLDGVDAHRVLEVHDDQVVDVAKGTALVACEAHVAVHAVRVASERRDGAEGLEAVVQEVLGARHDRNLLAVLPDYLQDVVLEVPAEVEVAQLPPHFVKRRRRVVRVQVAHEQALGDPAQVARPMREELVRDALHQRHALQRLLLAEQRVDEEHLARVEDALDNLVRALLRKGGLNLEAEVEERLRVLLAPQCRLEDASVSKLVRGFSGVAILAPTPASASRMVRAWGGIPLRLASSQQPHGCSMQRMCVERARRRELWQHLVCRLRQRGQGPKRDVATRALLRCLPQHRQQRHDDTSVGLCAVDGSQCPREHRVERHVHVGSRELQRVLRRLLVQPAGEQHAGLRGRGGRHADGDGRQALGQRGSDGQHGLLLGHPVDVRHVLALLVEITEGEARAQGYHRLPAVRGRVARRHGEPREQHRLDERKQSKGAIRAHIMRKPRALSEWRPHSTRLVIVCLGTRISVCERFARASAARTEE